MIGGQKNALRVVDGLSQVRYRAFSNVGGTHEAVTNRTDGPLLCCADRVQGGGIRVDDAMGFRINDQDPGLNPLEDGLEIRPIAKGAACSFD